MRDADLAEKCPDLSYQNSPVYEMENQQELPMVPGTRKAWPLLLKSFPSLICSFADFFCILHGHFVSR